jgi:hypothetical protein
VTRKAETPVDWFDFLFETYQHTSKEKLLELLASMPDCDELAKQSQRDLAITYFVKVFYTYIQWPEWFESRREVDPVMRTRGR